MPTVEEAKELESKLLRDPGLTVVRNGTRVEWQGERAMFYFEALASGTRTVMLMKETEGES
jgi:hypothetical protein